MQVKIRSKDFIDKESSLYHVIEEASKLVVLSHIRAH